MKTLNRCLKFQKKNHWTCKVSKLYNLLWLYDFHLIQRLLNGLRFSDGKLCDRILVVSLCGRWRSFVFYFVYMNCRYLCNILREFSSLCPQHSDIQCFLTSRHSIDGNYVISQYELKLLINCQKKKNCRYTIEG